MFSSCKLVNSFCFLAFLSVLNYELCNGLRKYTKQDMLQLREEVREMFQHAYNGYLNYASQYDELRPLSCDGIDTWGSYSLTLIDALDTLAVMGNTTEFKRVVDLLTKQVNFDSDINVSVFETNIRIVGGLLSAHLVSNKAGIDLEPGWPCNGPLLRLADDVARRLLPAFDTNTGMPYGTVNLKYGVPAGETSVTCTAGVGTFIIEFGTLSRLTGDPIFEEVALNALYALYNHRSNLGLFGNHIDVQTGRWTAQDAGIGAGVDSYYEYLVKGAIMLNRPELLEMFKEGRKAIEKFLKRDDWHIWVSMNKGQVTLPVFQSLEAYWPGLLSLLGDINAGMRSLHNYHSVWKQYGFLPEFYNIPNAEAGANRENYPLRPELIESVMYLYRATGDPYLLEVGEDMLRSIQYSAKTPCGYATIKNVRDHRKEDRMESFFLAETTKYLYLLFDPDNFLHNNGGSGSIVSTPNGDCVLDAGGYIFNTEAHPIDPAALKCCYEMPRDNLLAGFSTKKFRGDSLYLRPIERTTVDNLAVPETNTIVEIDTKSSVEKMDKQNFIFKILTVLKKTQNELKTHEESVQKADDNIISAVSSPDDGHESVAVEEPVELVKLPPHPDPDQLKPNTNDFKAYDDDDDSMFSQKLNSTDEELKSLIERKEELSNNSSETNTSILVDFVQSILKTKHQQKSKFNAQQLLETIYEKSLLRNQSWANDFELLTCQAQPYLQRLSIHGEFF